MFKGALWTNCEMSDYKKKTLLWYNVDLEEFVEVSNEWKQLIAVTRFVEVFNEWKQLIAVTRFEEVSNEWKWLIAVTRFVEVSNEWKQLIAVTRFVEVSNEWKQLIAVTRVKEWYLEICRYMYGNGWLRNPDSKSRHLNMICYSAWNNVRIFKSGISMKIKNIHIHLYFKAKKDLWYNALVEYIDNWTRSYFLVIIYRNRQNNSTVQS